MSFVSLPAIVSISLFLISKYCSAQSALVAPEPSLGNQIGSNPVLPALQLQAGQSYPLEGLITHRYSISKPGIITVTDTPQGLTIRAIRPGNTTFIAYTEQKTISLPVIVRATYPTHIVESGVSTSNQSLLASTLNLLRQSPGVRLTAASGKTRIEGEILSRKVYQKALLLLQAYPERIEIAATTAPGIKASLMEQALANLRAQGLSQVEIACAGHHFYLYGAVSQPTDVEQAFEIVRSILPTVENRLPLPIHVEPTITVKVSLLELSKRAHQELGLGWQHIAQPFARLGQGSLLTSPSWDVLLKNLSTKGQAKVLAEPQLSVKLGSSAELSAGGEFPIRLTEKFENRVAWKYYGLKLRIQILGVSGRRIRCRVETESSQLDSAVSVGGIPGVRTNHVKTEIDATESEPVLLTGLFQSAASKDVEKLPILGQIPIIGELFKSRGFRNEESELLIALIPYQEMARTSLPLKGREEFQNLSTSWEVTD